MIRIIYALPLLVLVALGALFVTTLTREIKLELISRPVPEFSVPNFMEKDGAPLTKSDLTGGIKMLSFFATWCPACLADHKQLRALSDKYGLQIHGIAFKDKPEDLENFLETYGNPFDKIALDNTGDSYFAWGVTGMPESYIIDAKGNIRYKHEGVITPDQITTHIIPIIEMIKQEELQ